MKKYTTQKRVAREGMDLDEEDPINSVEDLGTREILKERADVYMSDRHEYVLADNHKQLGSQQTNLDKMLNNHRGELKWYFREDRTEKICPECGAKFYTEGTRRKYCSVKCYKKADNRRRSRAEKRKRYFKPKRGECGQIYVKTNKNQITFIPALWTYDLFTASQWIRDHFRNDNGTEHDMLIEQVKQVFEREAQQ
jgi:hypothetical protein